MSSPGAAVLVSSLPQQFHGGPSSRPRVDWHRRDRDDRSPVADADSIARDYAREGQGRPIIYSAWLPLWLLSERLWEDIDGGTYSGWPEYRVDGLYPPIKVEIGVEATPESMSFVLKLHIRDGNHRVRYWKRVGFLEAPAWVLDYRSGSLDAAVERREEWT